MHALPALQSLPIGSIVVPLGGVYLGSYKESQEGTTMEPVNLKPLSFALRHKPCKAGSS